jgi:hypothetical protein
MVVGGFLLHWSDPNLYSGESESVCSPCLIPSPQSVAWLAFADQSGKSVSLCLTVTAVAVVALAF